MEKMKVWGIIQGCKEEDISQVYVSLLKKKMVNRRENYEVVQARSVDAMGRYEFIVDKANQGMYKVMVYKRGGENNGGEY